MKKKIITIVMASLMMFVFMPNMAFAGRTANYPTTWDELQSMIDANIPSIVLKDDIVADPGDEALKVLYDHDITIDLNGHTINRRMHNYDEEGSVFIVQGGDLTICDKSFLGNGSITGGYSKLGGGVKINGHGSLTFKGGMIEENKANYGGGIFVGTGSATLNGGVVRFNKAIEGSGGGISVAADGELSILDKTRINSNSADDGGGGVMAHGSVSMVGGAVEFNKAEAHGGGIYAHGEPGATQDAYFVMYGGKIRYNKSGQKGGGVIADKYNMNMIMVGGDISYNEAEIMGGGIYAVKSVGIGGSAKVKQNVVNNQLDNVYLKSNNVIWLPTDVDESMSIGVTLPEEYDGIGTFLYHDSDVVGLDDYFFSDKSNLTVVDKDDELQTKQIFSTEYVDTNTISNVTYSGKAYKPAVSLIFDGNKLSKYVDYTVAYSNNTKVGTAKVTLTGTGIFAGKITKTFKINPKGTKITSLKKGNDKFTVKVRKMSKSYVNGYQVRYSLNKNMSNAKTRYIGKKYNKTSLTVKELKSKKRYYVQVRTFKTVGGKNYYSNWSAKKSVKVK